MAFWGTRGLRGSAFEELVELTNRLYIQKGAAVIQKVPTPITPIEVDNKARSITRAYFEKKSTVDFIGVAGGLAVCFDAKETKLLNLPLKNIHPHQVEFMEKFAAQGGASFLLVSFKAKGEVFVLPIGELSKWHRLAAKGGRKSIPYGEFDRSLLVESHSGFPLDYLKVVRGLPGNCRTCKTKVDAGENL